MRPKSCDLYLPRRKALPSHGGQRRTLAQFCCFFPPPGVKTRPWRIKRMKTWPVMAPHCSCCGYCCSGCVCVRVCVSRTGGKTGGLQLMCYGWISVNAFVAFCLLVQVSGLFVMLPELKSELMRRWAFKLIQTGCSSPVVSVGDTFTFSSITLFPFAVILNTFLESTIFRCLLWVF